MARKFATGSKAWGICQRCGQRDYLKNLVKDGQFPGILVHTRCYDPKNPLEKPVDVTDPTALRHPSPEVDRGMAVISWPNYDVVNDITYLGSGVAE